LLCSLCSAQLSLLCSFCYAQLALSFALLSLCSALFALLSLLCSLYALLSFCSLCSALFAILSHLFLSPRQRVEEGVAQLQTAERYQSRRRLGSLFSSFKSSKHSNESYHFDDSSNDRLDTIGRIDMEEGGALLQEHQESQQSQLQQSQPQQSQPQQVKGLFCLFGYFFPIHSTCIHISNFVDDLFILY
jgi:hypothetical protein